MKNGVNVVWARIRTWVKGGGVGDCHGLKELDRQGSWSLSWQMIKFCVRGWRTETGGVKPVVWRQGATALGTENRGKESERGVSGQLGLRIIRAPRIGAKGLGGIDIWEKYRNIIILCKMEIGYDIWHTSLRNMTTVVLWKKIWWVRDILLLVFLGYSSCSRKSLMGIMLFVKPIPLFSRRGLYSVTESLCLTLPAWLAVSCRPRDQAPPHSCPSAPGNAGLSS